MSERISGLPCACAFDDNDNVLRRCAMHAEMEDRLARVTQACRRAVVALAHAAIHHPEYTEDYQVVSDAIESLAHPAPEPIRPDIAELTDALNENALMTGQDGMVRGDMTDAERIAELEQALLHLADTAEWIRHHHWPEWTSDEHKPFLRSIAAARAVLAQAKP